MPNTYRNRRVVTVLLSFVILIFILIVNSSQQTPKVPAAIQSDDSITLADAPMAVIELEKLVVKGRAPKTDYSREQFGSGWTTTNGCDTRNII